MIAILFTKVEIILQNKKCEVYKFAYSRAIPPSCSRRSARHTSCQVLIIIILSIWLFRTLLFSDSHVEIHDSFCTLSMLFDLVNLYGSNEWDDIPFCFWRIRLHDALLEFVRVQGSQICVLRSLLPTPCHNPSLGGLYLLHLYLLLKIYSCLFDENKR